MNSKSNKKQTRGWSKRVGYRVLQRILQVVFFLAFRLRVLNLNQVPESSGALICSNHQSNLDPILVGVGCSRRFNFLARKTLFHSKLLGWIIGFLDAIPLDQDGMGIGGIKETMKRLKRNELVLVFPEGTRTPDGELQPFSSGFIVMARRTKTPLVPVALDGAFQAWPRNRKFPLPKRIVVSFGKPIEFEEYRDLDDERVLAMLYERIESEFKRIRSMTGG